MLTKNKFFSISVDGILYIVLLHSGNLPVTMRVCFEINNFSLVQFVITVGQ